MVLSPDVISSIKSLNWKTCTISIESLVHYYILQDLFESWARRWAERLNEYDFFGTNSVKTQQQLGNNTIV